MDPIRTALLSFGMSGRVFHAPFIQHHPGFELAGGWERSKNVLREHYPAARSYGTFEDILGDPAIDLVVVNTPTLTHFDFARDALRAGKHVVVEKAFAGDAAEAAELRDLARQNDLRLAVFQNRRWDSDFLSVRDVMAQGSLGDIVEATLSYSRFDPSLSPKTHKEIPSSGSGIVKDLGPHVIDQALVLFGMPEAVFADIGVTRSESQVDDYFDILLRYPGKRVHVTGGYFFLQPLPEYALFGTSGCYLKPRSDVQEAQLDEGMKPGDPAYGVEPAGGEGRLHTIDHGRKTCRKVTSPPGNYLAFYDGLHRSLARGEPEPVTAEDGVCVMRIIDAAMRSHREGRLIEP
jgi:predicted dehydrogenase